jgi:SagB-type dehydrogenase family enzyme
MYVLVKPRRIPGIMAGLYYYHPKQHRLVLITPATEISSATLGELGQSIDEQAAFELFLVARVDAVAPMYGPLSPDFCLLESGYMGRLLSFTAASNGIALAPVWGVNFESCREIFQVTNDAVLLNLFQGGFAAEGTPEMGTDKKTVLAGREPAWARLDALWKQAQGGTGSSLPALRNEIERLEFKLREAGLRKLQANQTFIQLEQPKIEPTLLKDYLYRQSDREFLHHPVPLPKFGSCLFNLSEECRQRQSILRSLGLNAQQALQIYLYLKKDAVEGLAAGTYRYHPDHSLELISKDVVIDSSTHGGVNRPLFEQSAFSIYFVGDLSLLEPACNQWTRDVLLLEAGSLGQNLMMAAPQNHIGLCAVGSFNFDAVRPLLGITSAHQVLLHSFCGGRIVPRYRPARAAAGSPTSPSIQENVPAAARDSRTSAASIEAVRAFLSARLPEYMLPPFIVELKDLPLSSNGKVDRNALPSLDADVAGQSERFVAPTNPMEQLFADMWRDLMKLERVGIHDNFFSLGGDSVKGIQFLSRVRQKGLEVAVREFFQRPTIAELARIAVPVTAAIPGSSESAQGQPSEDQAFANSGLSEDEINELIQEFGNAEKTA